MVASSSSGSSRGGGDGGGGRDGGGSEQQGVKKGPWTTAEDAILVEYVRKHGEGNWNAVQRNCGLLRCGKSCRLRWANHLRPNLKKGAFSAEEERLIIELHAKLGNKWARMASQLPGRTDNEIKNYWNTRVKRLQRAGLPIYPEDVPQPYDQSQLQQQQQRHPNPSSPSFSSLFSSSPSPSLSPPQYSTSKLNPSLSLFHPYSFSTMAANSLQPAITSPFLSNPNPQFDPFRDHNNRSNGSFLLPFPSPSPSSSSLFNQSFQGELLPTTYPQPLQFKPGGFDIIPPPPPPPPPPTTTMGACFNPLGFVPGTEIELPSIQSPVPGVTTEASTGSTVGGGDCIIETTPSTTEYSINITPDVGNSGLLDALLEESKALSDAEKLKQETSSAAADKGKAIWVSGTGFSDDAAGGVYDSSSAHSSIGMKENDPFEEMNAIDDDLSSLLNNFPLTVPVPDWYDASATSSYGQTSNVKDGYTGLNNFPEASPSPVATTLETTNPRKTVGSCCWNNMPDIC